MEYDGCCSHSALAEGVRDDFENLTPEQMAAKELEIEQRRKEQKRAKKTTAYHDLKRLDFPAWKAKQAAKAAKLTPKTKARYRIIASTKIKNSRKFACEICNVVFERSFDLNLHNNCKKHLDMVSGTFKVHKNVAERKHQ
jgi:hypothetical protein